MRASEQLIQINQDQCLPPCINACSFEKEFDQVIELEDVPAYQPPNSPVTPIIFGGSVHNAGRDIDAKGKVFKRVTKFIDEYQLASSDNPAASQFLQSRLQRHWNYRRYTMMQMMESFQQTVYRGPPLPDVFPKKKTTSTRSFRTPFHFTLRQ